MNRHYIHLTNRGDQPCAGDDLVQPSRPRRIQFQEPAKDDIQISTQADDGPLLSDTPRAHSDQPQPQASNEELLKNWPHVPQLTVLHADGEDPFQLFQPALCRYFDEDDHHLLHHKRYDAAAGDQKQTDVETPYNQSGALVDKKYAYTFKGNIKDLYYFFRPVENSEDADQEDLELADEVNKQILTAMVGGGDAPETTNSTSGEPDGWDEDDHSPTFWSYRMREIDYFVKHNVWSTDPIGDWSYLNHHKVPSDFLRKVRRYFEIRPLEYLHDTGSYRMYHVLNQYKDLHRIVDDSRTSLTRGLIGCEQCVAGWAVGNDTVEAARQMELDYLAMIWLSIWDPRLKANVFQLKEMSMSDWFFTRVGWGSAVGVKDLLVKAEVHGNSDFWEHRAAIDEEDEDAEFEELAEWITGEDEETHSRLFEAPSIHTGQNSSAQELGNQTGHRSSHLIITEQNETSV